MLQSNGRTLVSFDWAMKRLLRDKANFDVLEGFLSSLLNEEIRVIHLLESEANQEDATDKFNRVDLLVQDSEGIAFIIEVQYSYASHYLKRLLFGAAKLLTERIEAGDEYGKVQKIISISLLYFPLSDGDSEGDYVFHGKTEFYGRHSGKLLNARQDTLRVVAWGSELTEKHNIFPEYYLIDINHFPNVVKDALDEWIYFFKHSEIPAEFKAKNIQTARQKLNRMKMSEEERHAYDRFLLARSGYLDELQSAEQKGRKEGREEGIEEGRKAERLAIAQMMKQSGIALAQIIQVTGVSAAEIES